MAAVRILWYKFGVNYTVNHHLEAGYENDSNWFSDTFLLLGSL
jgi:hypothetical protein